MFDFLIENIDNVVRILLKLTLRSKNLEASEEVIADDTSNGFNNSISRAICFPDRCKCLGRDATVQNEVLKLLYDVGSKSSCALSFALIKFY